jgi:hypothetical protein
MLTFGNLFETSQLKTCRKIYPVFGFQPENHQFYGAILNSGAFG